MKHILTILLIATAFVSTPAFCQDGPLPSPAGSVSTNVGMTEVKVDYFRPKMNGRKVFGAGEGFLVPFGTMWRTGANSGSILKLSDDVTIEGQEIPAGEYTIFTIPNADKWIVTLYKDTSIGGYVSRYDDSKELTRFTVSAGKKTETVETLTFQITDLSEDSNSASLEFSWENTTFALKISDK